MVPLHFVGSVPLMGLVLLIGGFAIAAQNCGYTTIGFCEKEPYAQQILKERFGAILADTTEPGRKTIWTSAKRDVANAETVVRCATLHDDIFTLNGADYAGVDLIPSATAPSSCSSSRMYGFTKALPLLISPCPMPMARMWLSARCAASG